MKVVTRDIMSKWDWETGTWSEEEGFINRKHRVEYKKIQMEINLDEEKPIIRFLNAPTGFESYYLSSLFPKGKPEDGSTLVICAGTINSWARCEVSADEVYRFIQECT